MLKITRFRLLTHNRNPLISSTPLYLTGFALSGVIVPSVREQKKIVAKIKKLYSFTVETFQLILSITFFEDRMPWVLECGLIKQMPNNGVRNSENNGNGKDKLTRADN
jgi:hypothetical protein